MSDIFISYSRKDKAFVWKINEGLEKRSRDVWIDWEDIPPTADWWHEITTAIEKADTFVFIISPDSIASPICNFEVAHATLYNKRIVPILYHPVDENQAFGTLANVNQNSMMLEILGERDLLAVASESWRTLSRHNWVIFDETTEFDTIFDKLLKVMDSDLSYIKVHTRLLIQALDWERINRNDGFLLIGDAITQAETWLESALNKNKTPSPTVLHQEFITASRIAEDSRVARLIQLEVQTRRSRRASMVLGVLIVVTIIITVVAITLAKSAFDSAEQASLNAAIANTQAAAEQTRAAQASSNESLANTQVADEQARAAQASSNESVANTQAADEQARAATAQRQVANAQRTADARVARASLSQIDIVNTSVAQVNVGSTAVAQSHSVSTTMAQMNAVSTTIAQNNSFSTSRAQMNFVSTSIAQNNSFSTSIAQMNAYNTPSARVNIPNSYSQSTVATVRITTTPIPTPSVIQKGEIFHGSVRSDNSQHWHYSGQADESLFITLSIVKAEENPVRMLIIVRDPQDNIMVTVEQSGNMIEGENQDIQLDELVLTVAGLYDIEVLTRNEPAIDYTLIVENQ